MGSAPGAAPCEAVRESLSARLDDEQEVPLAAATVRDHLAGCRACAEFEAALADLHRHTRVAADARVPDLTDRIVAAATAVGIPARSPHGGRGSEGVEGRSVRTTRDLRLLVGVAGAAKILVAVASLFGPLGPSGHVARDLATVEVALGVGLLVAAFQPERARGLLPVLVVVAAAAVGLGVIDVVTGAATVVAELTHLTEVIGVLALWALVRSTPRVPALRPQAVA